MEIISVEAKRSGKGFITENGKLIKALKDSTSDNLKIIDTMVGRKGFLEYLRTLDKDKVLKVIPYQGSFEYESSEKEPRILSKEGKGIKIGRIRWNWKKGVLEHVPGSEKEIDLSHLPKEIKNGIKRRREITQQAVIISKLLDEQRTWIVIFYALGMIVGVITCVLMVTLGG